MTLFISIVQSQTLGLPPYLMTGIAIQKNMSGRKEGNKTRRLKKHEIEASEIDTLIRRCNAEAPDPGSMIGKNGQLKECFDELPLSQYTLSGLSRGKFTSMTKIQQLAIPHALAGRDILASAKTGSGKTLAFTVPMLERLYRAKWTPGIGAGGIIISPTRELALQIFEVVRVIAFRHGIPAGLVMGGSDFRKEQSYIHNIAVLIATPGRLLQHLEQTPTFDVSKVELFVLDEADRLLDLGFKEQLTQIINHLPRDRQTMLFSATQTKSVKSLAKLSLRNPEYISIYDTRNVEGSNSLVPTPANLAQAYSVCQLPDKLDVLYSFIRSHLKSKVIVFFSSCKQVRYVDAAFRKLRPGVPLMCIHGKIKQQRRLHIYYDFIKKPAAVMFATDIAARGLDFPDVDWVVQVDCPEDTASYIHRVGRTARYKNRGHAWLLLLPNEAPAMLKLLEEAQVPIVEKVINPSKQQSIRSKLQGEIARDTELKMIAQRAFKSYVRSVKLQTNKDVFDVHKLPLGNFASSLGLLTATRLKLAGEEGEDGRKTLRNVKNMPHALKKLRELNEPGEDDDDVMMLLEKLGTHRREKKSKYERLLNTKASDAVGQSRLHRGENSDDDDADTASDTDDVIVSKNNPKKDKDIGSESEEEQEDDSHTLERIASKKQKKHLRIDSQGLTKGMYRSKRKEFDEEGNEVSPFARLASELANGNSNDDDVVPVGKEEREVYLERIRRQLEDEDKVDRQVHQDRVRAKHLEKKMKQRMQAYDSDENGGEQQDAEYQSEDHSNESSRDDESDDNASSSESDDSFEFSGGKRPAWAPPSKSKVKKSKSDIEAQALRLIG